MDIVYEDVIPSLIPNTTTKVSLVDGNPSTYRITPVAGYVLHDKARDWYVDPDAEVLEVIRGYTRGTASCHVSYDLTPTAVIDGYDALGTREFFARPESEVPSDQIFSAPNNNPEVM